MLSSFCLCEPLTSEHEQGCIFGEYTVLEFESACLPLRCALHADTAVRQDSETKVDVAKAESVVRIVGSARTVHRVAAAALALGCGGLAALAAASGDPRVGWRLAAAIACGVLYQAPPFRLSYKGLGEPLCFASFGPLATSAFYLAAASSQGAPAAITPAVSAAAAIVGITTTSILLCSHFHQEKTDLAAGAAASVGRIRGPHPYPFPYPRGRIRGPCPCPYPHPSLRGRIRICGAASAGPHPYPFPRPYPYPIRIRIHGAHPRGARLAPCSLCFMHRWILQLTCTGGSLPTAGKMSPIVRLGVHKGYLALAALVATAPLLAAASAALGALPLPAACAALAATPAAATLVAFVAANRADPTRIFRAKFYAVRWHTATGVLLAAGLALSRVLGVAAL